MYKRIFVILLVIYLQPIHSDALNNQSLANNETTKRFLNHQPGEGVVFFSGGFVNNQPFGTQFVAGMKFRIYLSGLLSFDTDFMIGDDYFHFGVGIFSLPLILFKCYHPIIFLMAIMALEHTAIHLPLSSSFEFSPYVSLLRYKK